MAVPARAAMPSIVYHRAPCPGCGATTLDEAQKLCRPTTDQTGEVSCPGDEADDAGYILQPTPASLAAMDAWIDRHAPREQT